MLVFTHKSTRWTPRVLGLNELGSNPNPANPKSETNSKYRKSKIQDANRHSRESGRFNGVFFVSNLGFVSDFEFRISDLSARLAVSSQEDVGHVQHRMGEGESSSVDRRIQPRWKPRETGPGFPSPVRRERVRVRDVFFEKRLLFGTCVCTNPKQIDDHLR